MPLQKVLSSDICEKVLCNLTYISHMHTANMSSQTSQNIISDGGALWRSTPPPPPKKNPSLAMESPFWACVRTIGNSLRQAILLSPILFLLRGKFFLWFWFNKLPLCYSPGFSSSSTSATLLKMQISFGMINYVYNRWVYLYINPRLSLILIRNVISSKRVLVFLPEMKSNKVFFQTTPITSR